MAESWRPVTGFEQSYEISDRGNLRSKDRHTLNGKGGLVLWRSQDIKPYLDRNGHVQYNLYRNSRVTKIQAHRAVLEAFVGPAPAGHECCHRDGDPGNNSVENLYWGTRSDNMRDAVRHGTHNNARKVQCKQGHPLSGDNLIEKKHGNRACRECHRAANVRYRQRAKAGA